MQRWPRRAASEETLAARRARNTAAARKSRLLKRLYQQQLEEQVQQLREQVEELQRKVAYYQSATSPELRGLSHCDTPPGGGYCPFDMLSPVDLF